MAYLGLVPSEHFSGANVRRGGITKAGNVLARRVLIEGAWTPAFAGAGSIACRHASAASFMTATRSCRRRSATSLGKGRSGCARAIGGWLRRASRRLWSLLQSPVRWSALSGRSPASPSPRSRADQIRLRQRKEVDNRRSTGAHCRRQGRGGEPSCPVMSRSPDRRSSLERGRPETKPRSCGSQSAHESLFNRRLRVLSPAVRTSEPTSSAAAETNNCVRTLESEHERPHRRSQELGLLVAGISPLGLQFSLRWKSGDLCFDEFKISRVWRLRHANSR